MQAAFNSRALWSPSCCSWLYLASCTAVFARWLHGSAVAHANVARAMKLSRGRLSILTTCNSKIPQSIKKFLHNYADKISERAKNNLTRLSGGTLTYEWHPYIWVKFISECICYRFYFSRLPGAPSSGTSQKHVWCLTRRSGIFLSRKFRLKFNFPNTQRLSAG